MTDQGKFALLWSFKSCANCQKPRYGVTATAFLSATGSKSCSLAIGCVTTSLKSRNHRKTGLGKLYRPVPSLIHLGYILCLMQP